jgi:hypothetical protein
VIHHPQPSVAKRVVYCCIEASDTQGKPESVVFNATALIPVFVPKTSPISLWVCPMRTVDG